MLHCNQALKQLEAQSTKNLCINHNKNMTMRESVKVKQKCVKSWASRCLTLVCTTNAISTRSWQWHSLPMHFTPHLLKMKDMILWRWTYTKCKHLMPCSRLKYGRADWMRMEIVSMMVTMHKWKAMFTILIAMSLVQMREHPTVHNFHSRYCFATTKSCQRLSSWSALAVY